MQDAATHPNSIVGRPFAQSDRAIAKAWGVTHRANGVKLFVATDHEAFPEVIEIAPAGTAEPRWCIWRDRAGRFIVDNWQTWERGRPFAVINDALAFVATEISALQRVASMASRIV
jgi:hypothetical protein